jgi:hypothetical protein
MSDGGQIRADHAGRGDGRSGADDAQRALAQRWATVKKAWQKAYCERSRSAQEKHAREISLAVALAHYKAACAVAQGLRRGAAPHG